MTIFWEILGVVDIALLTILPIFLFFMARRQDYKDERRRKDYVARHVAEYEAFLNDDMVNFLKDLK